MMNRAGRIPALFLLLALFLAPLPARAEVTFDTAQVSPALWPWPAAVAVEDWGDAWRGVLWVDGINVTYSRTQGWSNPVYHETVTPGVNVGRLDAVADGDGEVHACFNGSNAGTQGIRYARRSTSGTWSVEWVATGANQGLYGSVGLLDGGQPVVAYIDATGAATRYLRYAIRQTWGWQVSTLDDSPTSGSVLTAAALATNWMDVVHVAWVRGMELRYCRGPGQPVEIVATGVAPTTIEVAPGRDGWPRIAFQEGGALRLATRSAGGWAVAPAVPQRANVRHMAFAIGIDDAPCLVYTTEDPDDPLWCAFLVRGRWHEQPLSDQPLYGVTQWPSISAARGLWANLDLVVAWLGDGLNLSADERITGCFANARLRAGPDGDLVSTVELYDTMGSPRASCPVILDFTAPGVMDTVNFCYSWRDTLRRWTDAGGMATFRLRTGGAVSGGIALRAEPYGPSIPIVASRSVPLAGVDLDGNGSVTPVDVDLFDQMLGTSDPRGDLDFDGLVDQGDRQLAVDRLWHTCTAADAGTFEARTDVARITGIRPNPADGEATIAWGLPAPSPLRVTVHDVAGRRVRLLVAADMPRGSGEIVWDGRDDRGRPVPGGVYFARLQAAAEVSLRRLVRLR